MERLIAKRNYRNTADRLIQLVEDKWLSEDAKQQITDLADQLTLDDTLSINAMLDEVLKEEKRQQDLQDFYYGPFFLLLTIVTIMLPAYFPSKSEYHILLMIPIFMFSALTVRSFSRGLIARGLIDPRNPSLKILHGDF